MKAAVRGARPEVGHVPQGQAADHGVGILAVLPQRVDDQQGKLGIQRGIRTQEDVDELLLDDVHSGAGLHHLSEEPGHVHTL